MKKKIGLGIITYNREDFFNQLIKTIPFNLLDEIVVVNDGTPYKQYPQNVHVIEHQTNQGVAVTKNDALKYLLNKNCDYLFLMEDDILIKDKNVFKKYIELYKETNIHHFNFGYHGPANKDKITNQPRPKLIVNYNNKVSLALNHNVVGAFSFYTKQCLQQVGLFDENYINAVEHVDHTYILGLQNFHPPFWWFADLADSYKYLDEIACSEVSSVIRFTNSWQENITRGWQYFKYKNGVTLGSIPQFNPNYVVTKLKEFKNK